MKKFTVVARVAEGKSKEEMQIGNILSELLLKDEKGDYSLKEESSLVDLMLSGQVTMEDSIPLIYKTDFYISRSNGTTSQLINDARTKIREVVAVVREGESHVSGYLLDNGVFIDIYYKEQFIYSYKNAIVDKDGILRVEHEETLPDIEVDDLPNSKILPHSINIVPSEENTGSSSRLKHHRVSLSEQELQSKIALYSLFNEVYYISPPLDFYNYVPADQAEKVPTCLRYVLTEAGEKWIDEKDTDFPIPKPSSALHGIPVLYHDSIENLKFCSRKDLRLWDEHQITRID